MTDNEKLNHLEELFDLEVDSLSEDLRLDEIDQWDSMSSISLIAMLDDLYGKVLSPGKVKAFKTVRDILDEME